MNNINIEPNLMEKENESKEEPENNSSNESMENNL